MKNTKKQTAKKTQEVDDLVYLFSILMSELAKREKEIREDAIVATNIASAEWKERLIPSCGGGYNGLSPSKILPETTKLLNENTDKLLEEHFRRKDAAKKLFLGSKAGKQIASYLMMEEGGWISRAGRWPVLNPDVGNDKKIAQFRKKAINAK